MCWQLGQGVDPAPIPCSTGPIRKSGSRPCTCALALTLAGLLHRQVRQAGLEISLEASLEELSSIQEVLNLYPPAGGSAGRLRAVTTYTEEPPLSQRLADLFRLGELKAN